MDLSPLVAGLKADNLAAFVGAGASRSYTDPDTGIQHPGLPAAGEIVAGLAKTRAYIPSSSSFPEACFLLKKRESRAKLEEVLVGFLGQNVPAPLPAYEMLASLPFAAFLTTNYDVLLETALGKAQRSLHPVVEDKDVCHLRSKHVPVIKIHGCVSRPPTMIAAEDEYRPLSATKPLIEALVKTQLANRVLLFLGFSLTDVDFRIAYQAVRDILGDRMPRSFAVVHSALPYEKELWESRGVQIVESDLTRFLFALWRAVATEDHVMKLGAGEDERNDAVFRTLYDIGSRPSETQLYRRVLGSPHGVHAKAPTRGGLRASHGDGRRPA